MKLTTIQKALEHYMLSADCPEEERQEVVDALKSCSKADERYDDRDIWNSEVYVIPAPALSELLNWSTYDIYGKRAKMHGTNLRFSYYSHDCRRFGLDQLSDEALELGFDVIGDLWRDNEAAGSHTAEGTFQQSMTPVVSLENVVASQADTFTYAEFHSIVAAVQAMTVIANSEIKTMPDAPKDMAEILDKLEILNKLEMLLENTDNYVMITTDM